MVSKDGVRTDQGSGKEDHVQSLLVLDGHVLTSELLAVEPAKQVEL